VADKNNMKNIFAAALLYICISICPNPINKIFAFAAPPTDKTQNITDAPKQEKIDIAFETIFSSYYGLNLPEGNYIFSNNEKWKQFYSKATTTLGKKAPEIDFDKYIVILVSFGSKPTGGYSIKIEKVVDTKSERKVYINKSIPKADMMLTQAFTNPIHAIKMKKTNKNIKFIKN
jgi:hypothetical protein